jgi:cyclopropane-fatty-acyl-phospholipid synthase
MTSDPGTTAQSLPSLRRRDSAAIRLMLALARRLHCGRLDITLPDGRQRSFRGPEPGPSAQLTVHRPRFIRRMLMGGALGFGEAYIDGDVDSADPAKLLELTARNEAVLRTILEGRPWARAMARLNRMLRPNTRRGARQNIAAHYDLGNDFYAAWLDDSMTYSSAVFAEPGSDLETAQREKYRRIADLAGLRPEHHVLEIGCGWGGFAAYAAQVVGCRVTALTISQAQYDNARARIAAAGLDDRVTIAFRDYRDETATYDRIVSIEMIEAVGEAWWGTYFRQLHDRLAAGGRAVLQAITMDDAMFPSYRRGVDFIQRYIFPGGMLLSPSILSDQAEHAGLTPAERASYGQHYAETLRRWRERFESAWPRINALGSDRFDERFRRLWRYYLAYCEAGFTEGRLNVFQAAFDRPAPGGAV